MYEILTAEVQEKCGEAIKGFELVDSYEPIQIEDGKN